MIWFLFIVPAAGAAAQLLSLRRAKRNGRLEYRGVV